MPRVFVVAKRLEIDYAPAMVGFEFRNGRAVPVYDGIVVCTEFKDAILEVTTSNFLNSKLDPQLKVLLAPFFP